MLNLAFSKSCAATAPAIAEPSFLVVSGAALVDSINPCAIAVLLILLTALLSVKKKRQALTTGLFFIAGLYLAYLALGLGLISVIQLSGLAGLFHKLIGALAIIIGLLNLKDYFWYGGGGFVMEIPRSWRPTVQKLLKTVTSPLGAFVMGLLITAFELPCTGGPYLFVLGLLANYYSWSVIIPTLLYYNLVFVLPLLIITALLYWGYSTIEKASAWKEKNLRRLHLVAGLIMLALGAWVFLN